MIEERGEPPVFPETIQNIYKVATVKIDSAVVVRLVNQEYTCEPNYYITQESALREYDGCNGAFLVSPDVINFIVLRLNSTPDSESRTTRWRFSTSSIRPKSLTSICSENSNGTAARFPMYGICGFL